MGITTDCRSETGQTVTMVDSVILLAQMLVKRDLTVPEVQEALRDLKESPEFDLLLYHIRTGSAMNS